MRLSCIKVFLGYTYAMNIEQLLKKNNIKVTTARVTLLKFLEAASKPVCYEEIKGYISMDKATFYRNMITFEEAGILNAFESNSKMRYFELGQTPHAHFVCTACNSVECIESIEVQLAGYEIGTIVIHGRCRSCVETKV